MTETLIIIAVIILLFGAKRLPELAKSLGKSIGEFKKGREEGTKALSESTPVNSESSKNDKV